MKINNRFKGEITIVDVSGRLTIGVTPEFEANFRELLDNGKRLFVINLLNVPFLDSAGIGEICASHKRAKDRNGRIHLVLNPKGHDLFTLYELHKIFPTYRDLEDALAAFAGAPVEVG